MTNLQTTLINRYQTTYPADTLKEVSNKTGIQITRVFRLFNGSEMKISEYESFEKALKESKNQNEFFQLSKECFSHLNKERLNYLSAFMKQSLKLIQLKNDSVSTCFETEFA